MLTAFSLYFIRLTPPVDGNISTQDMTHFIVFIVLMIILAIVAHVIMAAKSKSHRHYLEYESVVDERQKIIELKANAVSGHIMTVGVFAAMALGLWQPGNFWIIQGLIASLLISEVVNIALQLIYFRRGF